MKKTRSREFGLALAAFLGFACLAWGQSPAPNAHPHDDHGPMTQRMAQHMIERMIWELDLTPEQQATIRGLMEREGPRLQSLHATLRDSRRSVMELDPTDPAYAQTVAESAETAGRTLAEIIRAHGQLRAEVQALLTPEQRELAQTLRQSARDRMESHMKRPFERPPAAFIF